MEKKEEGADVKKENMVSTKENEIVNDKPRSRSSSVESSSWEYYTETEPEDSDWGVNLNFLCSISNQVC